MTWYMIGFIALRFLFLAFLFVAGFRMAIAMAGRMHGRRSRHYFGHGPDAVAVLAERFARGEIDESEYRSRKTVLEN